MWSLARAVLTPVSKAWAAFAVLHLVERLVLAGATFLVVRRAGGAASLAAVAVLAFAAVARGLARGTLRTWVEGDLHARAVKALFRGDLLRASVLESDEAEAAILEGIHHGARFFGELLPQLIADALASVILAVLLVCVAPHVLWILAFVLPAGVCGAVLARRLTHREGERAIAAYRPVIDGLVTAIHARLELVGNGRERGFQETFADTLRSWGQRAVHSERLLGVIGRAPLAAAALVLGAVLFFDGALHGELRASSLGDAALFASVLPAFAGLASALHELTKARLRFQPMASLLAGAELPRASSPVSVPRSPVEIVCRGVSFSYPGAKEQALSHLDLAWEKDRVLVLSGANGSGKSTVLRLLLGVTDTYEGKIEIGGVDMMALDLDAWRGSIGYLPQRPYLGERTTVAEAMALVAGDADRARLQSSLERMALWPVLASKSPHAPLSVRVGMLSAGERQRLALARVLASDCDVLLLDEPDANLDAAGVHLLAGLIRELAQTKRIALAAHTPELVALGREGHGVPLDRGRLARGNDPLNPVPREDTPG